MTCSICGAAIHAHHLWNFDHVVPMACGGARGRANKAPAHALCNSVKGHRHPFSLRTPADREAARHLVTPATYARLQRVWNGQ